ncbi:hypothetical protein AtEden1_Chr3g0196271 [Arabidopsis thaliana]
MILLISRLSCAIALISEFPIITHVRLVAIMTVYCLFTIKAEKLFHFLHDSQGGSVIITGSRIELCQILVEVMKDFQMPEPTESPEEHPLVRYLSALEIAFPQLTPNLLRTILGIITIAVEAGYAIGVLKLNELLSVRSFRTKSDTSRLIRTPIEISSRTFRTKKRIGITRDYHRRKNPLELLHSRPVHRSQPQA